MNNETTNLDQADEDILTYTASDEALEAAGGGYGRLYTEQYWESRECCGASTLRLSC